MAWRKYTLATILENYERNQRGNQMTETTKMGDIGGYEKFVFPTIVAVYSNLVLEDLVSVQPLSQPTGLVFYLAIKAGDTKGSIQAGTNLYQPLAGPTKANYYSSQTVQNEVLGLGDGGTAAFSGTLSWNPIVPGSVVITDGTQEVKDDGNGNLNGDNYDIGNINYQTGVFSLTFTNAPDSNVNITATYQYDNEATSQIPSMEISLSSSPVWATARKLQAGMSIESIQDAQAYHNIDPANMTVSFMQNQIMREISGTVLEIIKASASAGNVTWDRTPPAGVQWEYHKRQLYDTLVEASGNIRAATGRFRANWFVGGIRVCSVLSTLPQFNSEGPVDTETAGTKKIGTLGNLAIYENPDFNENEGLLGRKGGSFGSAGFVFAPYEGLYMINPYTHIDMVQKRAMMYRSAMKLVDGGQYVNFTMKES
jgi:hypothetical protein